LSFFTRNWARLIAANENGRTEKFFLASQTEQAVAGHPAATLFAKEGEILAVTCL
jgi:hypothetical protein